MGARFSAVSGEGASWHSLPLEVKEHVWQLMVTELQHDCRLAMRAVCRSWEVWHDGRCRTLKVPRGMNDSNFRAVFGRFSGLTELQISASHTLTAFGLRELASVGLSALTSLDLSDSYDELSIQDDGLEALSLVGFPALRSLRLRNCDVSDAAVKQISTISTLTELDIGRHPDEAPEPRVTDEGVRWLVNLPALTALDLSGQTVTDQGVETLAGCSAECGGCPALTSLELDWCEKVTNTGMWALRNLTTLTSLNVSFSKIDDVGMLSLSTLPALTDLNISYTDVTDEGLRALANLPALTSLNIGECELITDEGLAALPARVKVEY